MTREFLKNLGIEDAAIDKILDENTSDIGKEKSKAESAKNGLADAQSKLAAAQSELETLRKADGNRRRWCKPSRPAPEVTRAERKAP